METNKIAQEILRKKFVPYVCSDEYFQYCLENKDNFKSNVTQGLEAMEEYIKQSPCPAVLELLNGITSEKYWDEKAQAFETDMTGLAQFEMAITKNLFLDYANHLINLIARQKKQEEINTIKFIKEIHELQQCGRLVMVAPDNHTWTLDGKFIYSGDLYDYLTSEQNKKS